ICPDCGQPKAPHRVCPHCGSYKGKEVIEGKLDF
ncbi:MAG: 50S ribosomal protein L32, partial [Aquificae bacterium]|nr:50S ribosomal protein L32 [Aquificota bacterium]